MNLSFQSTVRIVALPAASVCLPALAGTLQGEAAVRERIALPPTAVFEAVLLDVSRADAAAAVLGRATIDPAGTPPFRFEIAYDDAAIQSRHRYVVRATIRDQGRLLFTTDTVYPVLDGRKAELSLRLVQIAPAVPPKASAETPGTLTGMFTYLADAASIKLCADGRRLPVAMEEDYRALEAAYLKAHQQPGQALLVSVSGSVAARPSAEPGAAPRPALIVQRFINVWPRETCGTPLAASPLRETYWKLVRLEEKPVEVAEQQREPNLVFRSDELRVSGNSGYNRITGSFAVDGDALRVGPLAGTQKACVEGTEQEQRFLAALSKVTKFRIEGSHLDVLDSNGVRLARFAAVALR